MIWSPRRLLPVTADLLLVPTALATIFLVTIVVGQVAAILWPVTIGTSAALAAATVAYIASHLLRAVRLYIVIGTERVRFTTVLGFHATTALIALAIPFKLGELIRLTEAWRLLGNDMHGPFAAWIDRTFDAVLLAMSLSFLVLLGQRQVEILALLGATLLFLAVTATMTLLLPGAMVSLSRQLLVSRSRRSLVLLKATSSVQSVLRSFPHLDRHRLALLAVVTLGVWLFEFLTVLAVLQILADDGITLAMVGDLISSVALVFSPPSPPHVLIYRLVSVLVLLLLVCLSIRSYLKLRLSVVSRERSRPLYRILPIFVQPTLSQRGRMR